MTLELSERQYANLVRVLPQKERNIEPAEHPIHGGRQRIPLTPKEQQKVLKEVEKGTPVRKMEETVGRSFAVIYRWIRENNIELKNKPIRSQIKKKPTN